MPARTPPGWQADFAAAPMFASVAAEAAAFSGHADWPRPEELNARAAQCGLRNAGGLPVRFLPQSQHLGQRDYEARILAAGQVPTRMGQWHDLLNALVWLSFPRSKAALNALQCRELAHAVPGRRTPLSDAATLFDESGLLLVAPDDEIPQLLRTRQWHAAFVARRDAWRGIGVHVFGHALLEKGLCPFPAMTAKCIALTAAEVAAHDGIDACLAQFWQSGRIARPADLFPLPVLGIPGLWHGNNSPDFYARTDIFRPA